MNTSRPEDPRESPENNGGHRRWPRFNLKLLFLITTIMALYFGIGANRSLRERRAIPAITAAGGTFGYQSSYFYPFRQVYIVDFEGRQFTDEKLHEIAPQLRDLSGLTWIQFIKTGITDNGLQDISTLHLDTLDFWDCRVTNAGLVHLKQMTSLSQLDLCGTLISDEAVPEIETMSSLRKLTLPGYSKPTPPRTSLEADLAQLGHDMIEAQPMPGYISDASFDALKRSLKNCEVVRSAVAFLYSGDESPSRGALKYWSRP